MRGRAGLLALLVVLMSAPVGAQRSQTYADMKDQVVVQRFADGRVIASSAPFAVVNRQARYVNAGKGSDSVSVFIEAWPDKPVEISFVASWMFPLMPTEVQGRGDPADPDETLDAHVGPPWKQTTARMLENSTECEKGQWCRWNRHYRIILSQDLVWDIVADEGRAKISMGIGEPNARWTIPRDHLIATLDAIGLLKAFQ